MRVCNIATLMIKMGVDFETLVEMTGINENRMRLIVYEPYDPNEEEAAAIAQVLNVAIPDIWPALDSM